MASGRGASQKRWRRRGGQRKELLIVNRRVAKKAKPKEKKKRKERDVVEATSEEEGGNRIRGPGRRWQRWRSASVSASALHCCNIPCRRATPHLQSFDFIPEADQAEYTDNYRPLWLLNTCDRLINCAAYTLFKQSPWITSPSGASIWLPRSAKILDYSQMKSCVSLLQRHAFKNLEMHALLQRRTQNCMRHVSWSPRQLAAYKIFHFSEVLWRRLMFFSFSSLPFPFFCSRHGFYEKVAWTWSQKESSWTFPQSSSRINLSSLLDVPPSTTLLPTLSSQLFLSRRFLRCTLHLSLDGGGRRCWRSHPSSLQEPLNDQPPWPASILTRSVAKSLEPAAPHCSRNSSPKDSRPLQPGQQLSPCGACFHRQVTSHSLEPETSRNCRVAMPSHDCFWFFSETISKRCSIEILHFFNQISTKLDPNQLS